MPDIKASHRKYMQHDSMSVTKMSKPNDVVFTNMHAKAIQIVTEGQIQNSRSQDHAAREGGRIVWAGRDPQEPQCPG